MRNVKIVSLLVSNYDEAIRFYTEKLGFRVVDDEPLGDRRWVTLSLPGDRVEVALEVATSADDLAIVGKQAGSFPLLALDSKDFDAEYVRLKHRGIRFPAEPETGPGYTGVLIEDLNGNKLFVSQETKEDRPQTAATD